MAVHDCPECREEFEQDPDDPQVVARATVKVMIIAALISLVLAGGISYEIWRLAKWLLGLAGN